jgi:hypothetical protein
MKEFPPFEPSQRQTARARTETVELADLKAFLRAHPSALDEDREFLSLLTPPAFRSGDNVLDMQSFLITRLKSQAAERAAREVQIKKALVADTLDERRMQKAVLAIGAARNFERLIDTITRVLPQTIAATRVTLNIERPEGDAGELAIARSAAAGPIRILAAGAVDRLLGEEDAILGTIPGGEAPQFPPEAGPIRSFVAARLNFAAGAPPGLLAIGAKSAHRFSRDLALHRYIFLSRIIEQSIRLWLDLPPD